MHSKLHQSTYDYYRPTDKQVELMSTLRAAAKAYSDVLEKELPDGPDKTYAIRKFREVGMWANVAATRLHDGTPRE